MPRNPLYNPGWAARLSTTAAAVERARDAVELAAAAGFASPAHKQAMALLDTAKLAHRKAFLGQFPDVADYSAWRLAADEDSRDGFGLDYAAEDFPSIEDVDAAYERALRRRHEGTLEQNFRLAVGQPPELAAFAAPGAVISSWRRFGETECMVSFCEAGGLFHICLAHRWGWLARQSNEVFRRIATLLVRESIGLMLPEAAEIFEHDRHLLVKNREMLRQVNQLAARFRFYRHLLPEHGYREEFARVELGWNGVSCVDPDWSAQVYATLPLALREAAAAPARPALGAPPRVIE